MQGGDNDIRLKGEEGLIDDNSGMKLLERTYRDYSKQESLWVKLKTTDGYESEKYMLEKTIMKYIEDNFKEDKTYKPKIETVIMCDNDNGFKGMGFDTRKFMEDYRRWSDNPGRKGRDS